MSKFYFLKCDFDTELNFQEKKGILAFMNFQMWTRLFNYIFSLTYNSSAYGFSSSWQKETIMNSVGPIPQTLNLIICQGQQ